VLNKTFMPMQALGSESSNFLMCSTIEKVKRILNNMVRKLKSEMK
jgi:hypothetical protein